MLYPRIIICIVISLFIISCSEDCPTNPSNTTSNEIFPLKQGNSWLYISYQYDSLGNIERYASGGFIVMGDTTISGETWHKFQMFDDQYSYMINRSDGVYMIMQEDTGLTVPSLVIKYPANIGDRCIGIFTRDTTSVTSISETITIGIGTFNCIKYESQTIYDNTVYNDINYYAKGYGLIKMEEWITENGGEKYLYGSMQLSLYKLN